MMREYGRYHSDRIRSTAMEKYGQSQVVEKYEQLFREILAEEKNS